MTGVGKSFLFVICGARSLLTFKRQAISARRRRVTGGTQETLLTEALRPGHVQLERAGLSLAVGAEVRRTCRP